MLAQEIQSLKQLNQRISEDAINLTRALKGDSRTQGAWGELVLERVLEASGLQAGRDYETQVSFRNDEGGRQRPDVIVHLPDKQGHRHRREGVAGRVRASTSRRRRCPARRRARRASSLRCAGTSTASPRATTSDIEALRTLDFVLLFIPVEAAFIEAVRADDAIYTLRAGEEHLAGQPEHAAGDAAHGRAPVAHRAAQRQRDGDRRAAPRCCTTTSRCSSTSSAPSASRSTRRSARTRAR